MCESTASVPPEFKASEDGTEDFQRNGPTTTTTPRPAVACEAVHDVAPSPTAFISEPLKRDNAGSRWNTEAVSSNMRAGAGTPLDTIPVEPARSSDQPGSGSVPEEELEEGKPRALPIHHRPDLLLACADLVNTEWQRSQAARVHSLQKSSAEFPVSLVLLLLLGEGGKAPHGGVGKAPREESEPERLLGHARLSRVVGHGGSLFVESVVVSRAERGKGYGRTLMAEVERYARSRGFGRLCLTTHDKQHFYAHLGYALSAPVQNAGAMAAAYVPAMETLLRFSGMALDVRDASEGTERRTGTQRGGVCDVPSPPLHPPPPPPPLHPPLHPPPPPPAPPPPPGLLLLPPPMPPSSTPTPALQSRARPIVQTLTETPYRDAKGTPIFWMHKDI